MTSVYHEYPKRLYHAVHRSRVVASRSEEDALGDEWRTVPVTPAAVPRSLPITEAEVDPVFETVGTTTPAAAAVAIVAEAASPEDLDVAEAAERARRRPRTGVLAAIADRRALLGG